MGRVLAVLMTLCVLCCGTAVASATELGEGLRQVTLPDPWRGLTWGQDDVSVSWLDAGFIGAAAVGEEAPFQAVAMLTYRPSYRLRRTDEAVASHLAASRGALALVPEVEVVSSRVLAGEGGPVAFLDVWRHDGAVARSLGFGLAAHEPLRQLSFVAPCDEGLLQLFVFMPDHLTAPAIAEGLLQQVPAHFCPGEAAGGAAARGGRPFWLAGLLGLSMALGVIVGLRLWLRWRRRRMRVERETLLGHVPGETPRAAWEDELE